jgi:hypothetical protein
MHGLDVCGGRWLDLGPVLARQAHTDAVARGIFAVGDATADALESKAKAIRELTDQLRAAHLPGGPLH